MNKSVAFFCMLSASCGTAVLSAEVRIPYTVAQPGRASLAIYNKDGQLVRTLLTGAPRKAGSYAESWDGLDRYGNALPAGEYTWKALATTGLRAEFITQIGQNVSPAWERATGNHEAPSSVAIDATGLYRLGATNEGGHWGVKTDLDGRHLWVNDRSSADPWVQSTVAVTLVKGRLFELMPNGDTYGYDAATGRLFTGGEHDPKPWNLRWQGYKPPADAKDDTARRLRAEQSPRDLAGDAANELIVAAFPQHDAVAWFSAVDGKLVDTASGLPGLAGVAVAKDGAVVAISQGAVVTLTRAGKSPRVLVSADKLECPWRLCISPASGDIYVAENSDLAKGKAIMPQPDASDGKTPNLAEGVKIANAPALRHHQVKRSSSAGALLKTYGRSEGRGDGVYVATDFRHVTDIEADQEGGLVVTEGHHTPPRRSARFDAEGKLLREWYGAQHYGILACPEPTDPRFVWTMANADRCALIRWEIDYTARTSRVVEIYQDVFSSNRYCRVPAVPYVFTHNGRIYIQGGAVQPSGLSLAVYDRAARRIRPCNACETVQQNGKKGTCLWNDLNDDGLATDDEMQWLDRDKLGGHVTANDLTLITTSTASGYSPGPILKPSRITAGGTPVYSMSHATKYGPWAESDWKKYPGDIRRAADGSWYGAISDATRNPNEGSENHGAWYYNSCSAIDRLVKWDKDLKPLWSIGRHSPDNDHEPGSTAMPRGIVGFTHGCVVWGDASDEETARSTVWTEDGLYVDELLRVPTDSAPKDAYGMFNANEYPQGHLHTDPQSGQTFYYAINSGGGSPIYRISGWDGWHRSSGTVQLSEAATAVAKRNGTGLKGEYFNTPDCTGEPVLTRTDPLVFFYWFAGQGGWPDGINPQSFSCRWTGQIEAPTTELYRFVWESYAPWRGQGWGTPGKPRWLRLWIGGDLILDTGTGLFRETTFGMPQAQGIYAEVPLKAGERYDLRLEAGFATNAVARLCWETPGLDRSAVLPIFLHPEPGPKRPIEILADKRPELIADFGFEEKEGFLTWSRAGVEIFGRLTGNARRVPGKAGMGVELEGRGEFDPGLFPIDEELRLPDTDYTVAFWFKTTSRNVRLCEAKRYSSYNNRWSDHVVSVDGGKVRFQLQGDKPLESADGFNDGQWHHVVTTVGSGGQRLHVDAKLIGTGKLTRRTRTSNRLGLDLGPGGGDATVAIDELRVLGRALAPNEIDKQ